MGKKCLKSNINEDDFKKLTPLSSIGWKKYFAKVPGEKLICLFGKKDGFHSACKSLCYYGSSSPKVPKAHLIEHGLDPGKIDAQDNQPKLNFKLRKFNEIDDYNTCVAKMFCKKFLSVNQVTKSTEIQELISYKYKKCPTSAYKVKKCIDETFNQAKRIISSEIQKLMKNGQQPSIMTDEWTSKARVQMINVIASFSTMEFNLGLVEIQENATAEHIKKLISDRLAEYSIKKFRTITADGAKVNQKLARISGCALFQCLNHGIHLGVMDTLYKQPITDKDKNEAKSTDVQENEDDSEFLSDESLEIPDVVSGEGPDVVSAESPDVVSAESPDVESESTQPLYECSDDIVNQEDGKVFIDEIRNITTKVKKISTKVLNSPKLLRTLSCKIPIYDCKTRWNSTFLMLERFHEITKELKVLYAKFDITWPLSKKEEQVIKVILIIFYY